MKIKVSAPGKLMLLGEHAVVYGYPCLVTAVDKRLYVEVELVNKEEDEIIAPQVKESRFVLESIAFFKKKFKIDRCVKITTKGDFSHSVGLGSSSAVTVATFKALSELFNRQLSLKDVFDFSYQVNLAIQGVGSGFDIAAATFGKTTYFVTGGKTIQPLSMIPLPLVVGYSGIKADTPYHVRKVAEHFKAKNAELQKIFEKINYLVNLAKNAITKKDYTKLGKLMTENHILLQKLGVSMKRLDKMVEAAITAGSWGAKLSGAGGGDCIIALTPPGRRRQVEKAIEVVGGEIISVKNNAEGVRIEN